MKFPKKYIFIFFLLFQSCQKEDVVAVFKNPSIEVVSAFSINSTDSEIIIDITEVYQKISEVGVVWAEKINPTISDNSLKINDIASDQFLSFDIPNLLKGKKYYARAFYKNGDEIVYSVETSWQQNYTGEWRRLKSPTLLPDEYIYAGDLDVGLSADIFFCYKVNSFTNEAISQTYFADFGEWNFNFFNNRNQVQKPFPLLFNPIRAGFLNNSSVPLTLYGGGYNVLSRGTRSYQRNMSILESSGSWAAYPGAEATTTSFGIGKLAYVLENLPNGKLWVFDYGDLSWKNIGSFPYSKPANYIGFDAGERFFMLVEPVANQEQSREFYEYLPIENKWIRKADFEGENRRNGAAFVIDGQVYFGLGKTPSGGNALRDIWEYNPTTNAWKKAADYPGAGTVETAVVGSIGRAFVGFGKRVKQTSVGGEDFRTANDFWQFRPKQ